MKKIDVSGMQEVLLDFPQQIKSATAFLKHIRIPFRKEECLKIVFCGIGGSALGAELLRSYLYLSSKVPIVVCSEYDPPAFVDSRTLVFVSSYSGETEETISAYRKAKERRAKIVVITSGGALKEMALRDKVILFEIPRGLPARTALGYLSVIPLLTLSAMGIIKDSSLSLKEVYTVLKELQSTLHPMVGIKNNIAKFLAKQICGKFAAVYSPSLHFDVCSRRLKNQLNENAKTLALSQVFPEMNHNEIMGWRNPAKLLKHLVIVMLRDKGAHPRVNQRMDITKKMLKKQGVLVFEVWSRGKGLLSRIFSLIYIGDFVSYYVALSYGVDPTPVDKIIYIKERLKECSGSIEGRRRKVK